MRSKLLAVIVLGALIGCGSPTPRRDNRDGSTDDRDAGHVVGPQTDADGDTIGDTDEGNGSVDTDGDGVPDTMDDDSDGDGISDADEAGDTDTATHPVDTDFDGIPDFRDLDADGDGLPDANELMDGTDPRNADTDGDGVSDLVEHVAGTSPTDASSSPMARGDFYFLVPYMQPPSPDRETLVFATSLQKADVFFMIDTSISMQAYIDTIRSSLSSTIIPGISAAIPDVQFGVGQFDHCPESNFMTPGICTGIQVDQRSTADTASVTTALGTLTADCRPVAEPYAQAAWVWATGDTSRWPRMAPAGCAGGEVGYGCARGDALPILVVVGDERFSESYRTSGRDCTGSMCTTCASFPSASDLTSAFAAIRGRLVVLGATGNSAEWAPIVTSTGAVDASGAPLIFPSAGSATVDADVVDAIAELASSTPLDISTRARDLDMDGVDATQFIDRIETNATGGVPDPRDATRVCVGGLTTSDSDGDGHPDTFLDVRPGTPVCFDIYPKQNDTVAPTAAPQLFRAAVDVVGDGITVLDTRNVYFLVPPDGTMILN